MSTANGVRWNQIDASAVLHSTVVIADGMKYTKDEGGHPVHHGHRGHVVIGKNVYIGPHTVLHRSRLEEKPTTIQDWVQIGALNNIGHHVEIGENTLITQGVCIGGSTQLGKNCFIGMNVTIRQHLTICDDVYIGMGSVVTKNIDKPGVYYGNPARLRRDWDGTYRG
jgi:UDP-3-O-[3-hydroxymyristoyl] glucosamine N-acyltransferase